MRLSPRIYLLIIAAMFLVPLLLAWFMYSGTIEYKPASTRNLGELVEPPLPTSWDGVDIIGVDGQVTAAAGEDLAKHWVILQPVPAQCDDPCVQHVTQLRQIHRAAGRDQSRVRNALLLTEPVSPKTITHLQQIYADFRLLRNRDGSLESAMSQASEAADSTYLIDPLGNIMMLYAAGADPNHLKKDLKRLLTWSKLDE